MVAGMENSHEPDVPELSGLLITLLRRHADKLALAYMRADPQTMLGTTIRRVTFQQLEQICDLLAWWDEIDDAEGNPLERGPAAALLAAGFLNDADEVLSTEKAAS